MFVATLIVCWAALSLLTITALARICRSGDYEDRLRRYGGDREVVSVLPCDPMPRSMSPDRI